MLEAGFCSHDEERTPELHILGIDDYDALRFRSVVDREWDARAAWALISGRLTLDAFPTGPQWGVDLQHGIWEHAY